MEKFTRKQDIRLLQAGLFPENWLVVKQKRSGKLVILHKTNDQIQSRSGSGRLKEGKYSSIKRQTSPTITVYVDTPDKRYTWKLMLLHRKQQICDIFKRAAGNNFFVAFQQGTY